MTFIKSVNKRILLPLIRKSHLSEIVAYFSRNNNLILNYHGVVKDYDINLTKNHLPLYQFEEQMNYFKKHFDIISTEEIFQYHSNKKRSKPGKCIAITFDDGYLNNLINAFPVLNSLNLPATIFVTGQSVRNPSLPLWYDLLDILNSKLPWTDLKYELQKTLADRVNISSFENYSAFKNFIKTTDQSFKNLIVNLYQSSNLVRNVFSTIDKEYWQIMNSSDLKVISKSKLIEIGSHGLTHSNLDKLKDEEILNEITETKKLLSEVIGKEIDSIAFPDGAYNDKVKIFCREASYKRMLAVTLKNQKEKFENDILPRLSISNTTISDSIIIQTNLSYKSLGF